MRFCWCTIAVKDMEESLRFYQEIVGLPLERRFGAGPGREIAFLGEGETKVELICDEAVKAINHGLDISLGFEVKSADEKIVELKSQGIKIHSGPFQPNPHIKFFFVLDPNGVSIQFAENIPG